MLRCGIQDPPMMPLDRISLSVLAQSKEVSETACLLSAGGSIANHLLGDYLRSLLAVLLTQFSRKRFPGGMDGVVRLAEKSEPMQVRPSNSLQLLMIAKAAWKALSTTANASARRLHPVATHM